MKAKDKQTIEKSKGKKKQRQYLKDPKTGLTIRQQRFIDKYEGKGTLKAACKYAGFTYDYGRHLIALQHIKAAINAKQKKLQKKIEVDQEWLLKRYKRLSDYRISDFFNDDGIVKELSEIPKDAIYAIEGLEVDTKTISEEITSTIQKFKLPGKKGTLDSIAKLLGLNKEKSGLNLGSEDKEVRSVKITYVGKKDGD